MECAGGDMPPITEEDGIKSLEHVKFTGLVDRAPLES